MNDSSEEPAQPESKYVRTLIGSVGCDDDSFCGIVLNVIHSDDGEPRVRYGEMVKGDRSANAPAWMYDMSIREPIRVRIDWEQNCTAQPGFWMGQRTALRLAHLLIEAALKEPAAHQVEGIE